MKVQCYSTDTNVTSPKIEFHKCSPTAIATFLPDCEVEIVAVLHVEYHRAESSTATICVVHTQHSLILELIMHAINLMNRPVLLQTKNNQLSIQC